MRMNKKYMLTRVMVMVILPLFLGGIIYYIFFPSVMFVKYIDRIWQFKIHIKSGTSHSLIFNIFRWYGLDFMWAFSIASAIYLIYFNSKYAGIIAGVVSVVVSVALEMAQLFEISRGTFDIMDITVEIIGIIFSIIINIIIDSRRKINEQI